MENQKSNKYKKSAKQMSQRNNKKQGKPQKGEKAKKGGRQGKQPISGFSTLSQVAGVPLKRTHHSSLDIPMPKYVSEPYPICPYCGEKIDLIADSFFVDGEYIHFDCMLSSIKEREVLENNQTISYIGSGAFGVCQKGENGSYTIVKRIEVENKDDSLKMKNYVEGLKV
ncbi:MAG: CPXCG motif-containing cysteine-rich protein [Spirochaetales bacterium]|nr:CPXCG motif-containing cysteine-rich protein [Spirochaetales bacterium]